MKILTNKLNQLNINKISILSTLVFYIIAHGYRFSNLLFSHDSLNVCEYKPEWELGIGRFMQPVLYVIRGVLGAPWLFSIISILWLYVKRDSGFSVWTGPVFPRAKRPVCSVRPGPIRSPHKMTATTLLRGGQHEEQWSKSAPFISCVPAAAAL